MATLSAANIKCDWANPEATAAAFTSDGYFKTGDIGYVDPDGYLFIVDRKKDIIIRGGENISAAEVEAALYDCAGICEAAVFGAPDDRLGEIVVAILHRREGSSISEEELREFLKGRLAAFKGAGLVVCLEVPLPAVRNGRI